MSLAVVSGIIGLTVYRNPGSLETGLVLENTPLYIRALIDG